MLSFLKKKKETVEVIADLDAIVTKTIGFRFQGRVHQIPPMTVQEFMGATNALAQVDSLRSKKDLTEGELLDAYEAVFSSVCSTVTRKDLESMHHTQVAALFNLVLECIMGKAQVAMEKKNTSMPTGKTHFQNAQASSA